MAHDEPWNVRFVGAVPVFQFQSMIVPGHPALPELELLDDELLDDELLLELLDDELLDDELLDDELLDDELPELLATPPPEPIAPWPPVPALPPMPPLPLLVDELPDAGEVDVPLPSPPEPSSAGSSCNPVAHAPTAHNTTETMATRLICKSMTNSVCGDQGKGLRGMDQRTSIGRKHSRKFELALEKPRGHLAAVR